MGSGLRLRGVARSAAGARGGQAGSTACASPVEQVSVAYRAAARFWSEGVDGTLHGLGTAASFSAGRPGIDAAGQDVPRAADVLADRLRIVGRVRWIVKIGDARGGRPRQRSGRRSKNRPAAQSLSCSEPLPVDDACPTMHPTAHRAPEQNALRDPMELIQKAGNAKLHRVRTPSTLELVPITLF